MTTYFAHNEQKTGKSKPLGYETIEVPEYLVAEIPEASETGKHLVEELRKNLHQETV